MPIVVVYTDSGQAVWQKPTGPALTVRNLTCPGNNIGSSLASGLRRAIEDAEAIEEGRDPERPSEKAMRLAMLIEPEPYFNTDESGIGLGEVDAG